jgi:serine/threonine protein kinase
VRRNRPSRPSDPKVYVDPELLEVLRDLVKALRSLYVDARIIHRDIAIKNLIITSQHSADSPKGVLIDFDLALDLNNVRAVEPLVGSDGFMAIGILSGRPHTYRHDLESLFYVFLWIAIGNDHKHDDAYDILEGIPKTSRLWKWCSMDFRSVGREKAADMSPEGFLGILGEFSADFAPLRDLAKELHALIFPLRNGQIFTGTETEQVAVNRLYDGMADAFNRSALAFQK